MNQVYKNFLALFIFCYTVFTVFKVSAEGDTTGHVPVHLQNNFYIRGGMGYGSPYTGDVISSTKSALSVFSYGKGLSSIAGCGYMVNSHIGAEIYEATIFPGIKYTTNGFNMDTTGRKYPYQINTKVQSLALLMPAVVFRTTGRKFNLYTRLALVLPMSNKLVTDANYTFPVATYTNSSVTTLHFALGCSGAMGVSYKLFPHVQVWAEANALSFSAYPKKMVITRADSNGVSNINTYTTQQKVSTYGLSGIYPANQSQFNGPYQANGIPFSNIGLQAGMSVAFFERSSINKGTPPPDKYLYIKGGLGYAFPFANYNFNDNGNSIAQFNGSTKQQSNAISFHEKTASFTAGTNGVIGAGYMLNEHFGLELDAHIGIINKRYTETGLVIKSVDTAITYSNYAQAKLPILLMPNIVIQTGGKILNVYGRLGLVLPVRDRLTLEDNYAEEVGTTPNATIISSQSSGDAIITTSFTLGYTGAIGLKYQLTHQFQFWGEVSFLSYEPYVKGASDGGYTVQYKFSVNPNSNMYPATFSLPYSNAGMQIGVSYRLSK